MQSIDSSQQPAGTEPVKNQTSNSPNVQVFTPPQPPPIRAKKIPVWMIMGIALSVVVLSGGTTFFLANTEKKTPKTTNEAFNMPFRSSERTPSKTPTVTPKKIITPTVKKEVKNEQETPDFTGWRDYSSSTYKLKIKYPNHWVAQEKTASGQTMEYVITFSPIAPSPVATVSGLVNILIYKSSSTMNTFIDTAFCDTLSLCASSKLALDTKVASLSAKKITYPPYPESNEVVVVNKGAYFFGFNLYLGNPYNKDYTIEEAESIFNKMLSSLIFTL